MNDAGFWRSPDATGRSGPAVAGQDRGHRTRGGAGLLASSVLELGERELPNMKPGPQEADGDKAQEGEAEEEDIAVFPEEIIEYISEGQRTAPW